MRPPLTPPPSPTTVAPRRSKTPRRKNVDISNKNNTPCKNALKPSFADLPLCLLEVIMSQLVLEDNIRASAACKSWREAGVSVRVVEKHPWLMWFPITSNLFRFFDPLQSKSYTLELPELADSSVRCSRDGWLLMQRHYTEDEMFFFNPFTRELISLPKFKLPFREIAFSCPPTSDDCVVLALNLDTDAYLTISTCHPGATDWITKCCYTYYNQPALRDTHIKLLYVKDRFYCYSLDSGCLYSFHKSSSVWEFHFPAESLDYRFDQREFCLAEKNGELFLMFTSRGKKLTVYKLVSSRWEEMSSTTLDGLTVFFSFYNAELRTNLPWIRNNVYFSKLGYDLKHCVSYSFDESMRPHEYCWLKLCPSRSLWINPPKNVLDYL
ncbi:unnamed protein product [Microthlaspi erraticum]|uniref:Uncharacterized protein n=1 Tax=Microthlaspi erraticum TaxID=1685480 RepID=A0A6D2HVI6_9BRAS|nr:unnamed protein product [Microthlaspi erraticum]CAA7018624.1 unnamed protein product [Microthlaspi erraticum]CAA7054440.1 unnamed protein product [Microthlaspi erraticum]